MTHTLAYFQSTIHLNISVNNDDFHYESNIFKQTPVNDGFNVKIINKQTTIKINLKAIIH